MLTENLSEALARVVGQNLSRWMASKIECAVADAMFSPHLHLTTSNVSTSAGVPTLEQLEQEMHELQMQNIGRLTVKKIVFRSAGQMRMWCAELALADACGDLNRLAANGPEATPLGPTAWACRGFPLEVDPDLQGPSPKIVKRFV